jgi:dTDP-4-dehydrorhamnose reductase
LADATAALLARTREDWAGLLREQGGLFHCACSGETTWYRFTLAVIAAARRAGIKLAAKNIEPISTSEYPTPARRPLNSRLNCGRLEREYGLVAPSWEDALADTLPLLMKAEFGLDTF